MKPLESRRLSYTASIGALALPLFLAITAAAQQATPKPDPWEPVRFLLGDWRGTATGEPGEGAVTRSYELVLENRFIHERNKSSYAAREAGKDGEVHEHWSFISYDRAEKVIRMRQFHQESFVISYALNREASTPTKLVFESERFENFDNAWRARETYERVSEREFVETFELKPPDKPFEIYSRTRLVRAD